MESQKIKNLSDHKDETYPRYQTKRWCALLMTETMVAMMKVVKMIKELRSIQKL